MTRIARYQVVRASGIGDAPLFANHPVGKMMSMTALFFQAMGILAIKKIVNIKV